MSDRMEAPIRVMVVDGSAYFRQSLRLFLAKDRHFEVVAVAADVATANTRLGTLRPDALVVDERLIGGSGDVLHHAIASNAAMAVLVLTQEESDRAVGPAMPGLRAGVGYLARPAEDLEARMEDFVTEVGGSVRSLLERRRARAIGSRATRPAGRTGASASRVRVSRVIAIGASTGGTVALRMILEALPPEIPGIVMVQHMPERFTGSFAENLDRAVGIEVRLAHDGDPVRPGCALLAPGNRHLEVVGHEGGHVVRVVDAPAMNRHRPSVDVLFQSVARCAGRDALGVLLTGMGVDGARGLLEIRSAGGRTIAQDEASSVVFGMPREAIECGAADRVVGLSQMAPEILRQAGLSGSRG